MSKTEAGVSDPYGRVNPSIGWGNRWHALRATRAQPATGFTSQPEPKSIGSFTRGQQLVAGNFLFAGHLVEAPGKDIWDLDIAEAEFVSELHGFAWLDDLAAVVDTPARDRAQAWVFGWIDRFGRGRGPGWTPDLTGRRLIRWINHALFLLNGQEKPRTEAFFQSLGQQTIFLSRRWTSASPGLPRFEALTGLIYAGLSLTGMERFVVSASAALAKECARQIDADGGIPTRNPEELLEVFTLLTWAAAALGQAGDVPPHVEHLAAIERIAPTLRALRHSDGALARFHGGGQGLEGRLDQALADAGVRALPPHGLAMGFARMSAGRTSIVVDAAPPPFGAPSANAHASALAIELTSGRRPLIVNCGSGGTFGSGWHRAGRATPMHSTLGILGYSSSRLARAQETRPEHLTDGPKNVRVQTSSGLDGTTLIVSHDGYAGTHGLTHVRQLDLSLDGRTLRGEDTLGALSGAERKRFERVLRRSGASGVPFEIRFHLHPDIKAELDLGGTAVSMTLKSGEVWVFRHDGVAQMRLDPSIYLQKGRLKPRDAQQIVLSAEVVEYAFQMGWTFAKAQDTPQAIRDLTR